MIGVDGEGNKRLLAMIPGYRESYENWLDVFRNLAECGVKWIGLILADGILGLWRAAKEVFPEAGHQRGALATYKDDKPDRIAICFNTDEIEESEAANKREVSLRGSFSTNA